MGLKVIFRWGFISCSSLAAQTNETGTHNVFLGVPKQSFSQDVMIYRLNLKAEVHHNAITLHLMLMIRLLLDYCKTTFTTSLNMKK